MLTALALTMAFLGSWEGDVPTQEVACLELVTRVGETRLSAFNPSDHPQLLLVGELDGVARSRTWIAPGGSLDARFAPGTLSGLALEVVSFGHSGWSTSGALPLEALATTGLDAVWIESSEGASQVWGRASDLLYALTTSETCFSGMSKSAPATATRAPRPTHVPVVTPADKRNGDLPPRLEKKPLPPF